MLIYNLICYVGMHSAPSTNPGERTFIPYVDEYPAYVNDKQTVAYCLDHVVNDLKRRKIFLKPIDEAKII